MATDLTETLHRISDKARFLTQRYEVVAKERADALDRVAELQSALDERDRELEKLRMRVEYLTVSSSLAPNEEEVAKTRARLSRLIRDIDSCIADLKE